MYINPKTTNVQEALIKHGTLYILTEQGCSSDDYFTSEEEMLQAAKACKEPLMGIVTLDASGEEVYTPFEG